MPNSDIMHWLEVHIRFAQGEYVAGEKVTEYFLPWLCQKLSHRRRDVDAHLIAESARAVGVEDRIFERITKRMSRNRRWDDYLSIEGEALAVCPKEGTCLVAKISLTEQVELVLLAERVSQEEWIQLLRLEGLTETEQVKRIGREKERLRKKRMRLRKQLQK